ncbi:hypothetical protein TARUN_8863 [Trichoderma arundinaceum]|uniref:Uncharacterized protein n=1 Tax=Trichoderma arundinaceum TaxID=490622 RepID=A0A395NCF7_TRIAR|nr:hypothetical protein TARUN_8863 [Trichoderma arundinaceum]
MWVASPAYYDWLPSYTELQLQVAQRRLKLRWWLRVLSRCDKDVGEMARDKGAWPISMPAAGVAHHAAGFLKRRDWHSTYIIPVRTRPRSRAQMDRQSASPPTGYMRNGPAQSLQVGHVPTDSGCEYSASKQAGNGQSQKDGIPRSSSGSEI